ncbi:MAG: c-type cytochrome [Deltaproteobacteria bacterium]|nr:c-type cytochrome [Deltaproteobacteria bacterium]
MHRKAQRRSSRIPLIFALIHVMSTSSASALDLKNKVSTISGGTLYQKLCADCHGSTGVPEGSVSFLAPRPTNLVEPPFVHTAAITSDDALSQIERVIREGLGENMISYKKRLTSDQITAVAEYVLYLRSKTKESPAIGELETVISPPTGGSGLTETLAQGLQGQSRPPGPIENR